MNPLTLQFVAESTGGRIIHGSPELEVCRVCTDSRQVLPGDLFVALRGERFDAHEFLPKVAAAHSVALLADEAKAHLVPAGIPAILVPSTRKALGSLAAAYRRRFTLPVVAVCGSNGKTSAKELIASVLREKGPSVASEASFNNDIGVPLTLLRIESGHEAAVLEAGTNHPGELRPLLESIAPGIGVLTSIGREHLEFFGDIDGVIREEGWIAEVLPADGRFIANGETPGLAEILARTKAPVWLVGFTEGLDFIARDVQIAPQGSSFRVESKVPGYDGEYQIKLLGRHHVLNALLAIATAATLGIRRDQVVRALAACAPPKMRLQWEQAGEAWVLNDAYNANADSMAAALLTFSEMRVGGRRVAVLGDMGELGDHTASAHEEVGRLAAASRVQLLIAVGSNADITAAAALQAGLPEVIAVGSVEQAFAKLKERLQPRDLILLKASRSAKLERIVDMLRQPVMPAEVRP